MPRAGKHLDNAGEVKKSSTKKIRVLPKSVKIENANSKVMLQMKSGVTHTLQIPNVMILKPIPKASAAIKTCKKKVIIEATCSEDIQKCTEELTLSLSDEECKKAISDVSPVKIYLKKLFCNSKKVEQATNESGKNLSEEYRNENAESSLLNSSICPEINLITNVDTTLNTTLRDPLEFVIPDNPTEEYIMAIQNTIGSNCSNNESNEIIGKRAVQKKSNKYKSDNQIKHCQNCVTDEKINSATYTFKSNKSLCEERVQYTQTKGLEQSKVSSKDETIEIEDKGSSSILRCSQTENCFMYNTLSGLIHYDKANNVFFINCFYCMKTLPLYSPMNFEDHVRTVHSNEKLFCNNEEPLNCKNGEISTENISDNDENKLLQKLSPQYIQNVLNNIDEDIKEMLNDKADASSFVEDINVEDPVHNNDIIENNSQVKIDIQPLYLENNDVTNEKETFKTITTKNGKYNLTDKDEDKLTTVEDDQIIFPIDVEEDDIPKPTNGHGIVFGVTNRAVIMYFLQYFKNHPKLWRFVVLEKSLNNFKNQYSKLYLLRKQLNEKWNLNITVKEIVISLKRIMRWFQSFVGKALYNAQFKILTEPSYFEYFHICLQICQNEDVFTAEIERYLYSRQTLLKDLPLHKNKHKRKDTPIVCDVCGKIERSLIHLTRHKKFHQPPQFQCTMCTKKFYQIRVMKQHVKSKHLNILDWMCEICGKTFRSQNYLHEHQQAVHCTIPYTCIVCGNMYNNQRDLTMHQIKYHVPIVRKWLDCVNDESPLSDEYKSGTPILALQEEVRDTLKVPDVESIKWRKKHLSKIRTNRFYGCFKCQRRFASYHKLRCHNRALHYLSRDKLLNCTICKKAVQYPINIIRHYIAKHKLNKLEATQLYHAGRNELAIKLATQNDNQTSVEYSVCLNERIKDEAVQDIEKLEADIQEILEKVPIGQISLQCKMCNYIAQHPATLKEHYLNKHKIINESTNGLHIETLKKFKQNQPLIQKEEQDEIVVEVVEEEEENENEPSFSQLEPLLINDHFNEDEDDFSNIIYEDTIEEELYNEYEI